jgi:general secretion pathway protein A
MYTRFFGLNEKPFAITPDPRYLFMSERHGEGLAHLVYGVTESGGFIQLTGEVGTGKTTLVRTLLGQIPAEVDVALVLNPNLTSTEFLIAICEELRIPLPEERHSIRALVDALNRHLLDAHARGRRTILLIDEAQNLSADVLEQLRLLTNLETTRQKLLQIILIAQPELRDMLSQQNLRQLAQRVTGRYHLEPLSRDETAKYIDHRLRVAGALGEIFDDAAKREVYRLSGGVPRIINVICDRALLGAYSREVRKVDRRTVRRAAAEVSGQRLTPVALKWAMPVVAVVCAGLIGAGLWSVLTGRDSAEGSVAAAALAGEPEVAEEEDPGQAVQTPEPVVQAADPDVEPPDVARNGGEQGPTLEEVLRAAGAATRRGAAMDTLFALWGADYDPATGQPCAQAEAAGLRCYPDRGSLSNIRQLNRPVVLTLRDSAGSEHEVVLVGLDDEAGTLAIGERRYTYPLDEISDLWFGQYLLVWRPPAGIDNVIRPGMTDENVVWLRQSLAAIHPDYRASSLDSSYFDDELAARLREFQRRQRLEADGVAGARTQILISSLLGAEGSPRLSQN